MTVPDRPTREQVEYALKWSGPAGSGARVLAAEVRALRADLDDQPRRDEACCDEACNGGACETCRCCAAGWCVTGYDGLPEDADDLAGWIEAAAEHNPVVAAWRADRAALAARTPQPALPSRDDDVAAWIKTARDHSVEHDEQWHTLDGLLDDYRLHADTGTPLSETVSDGGYGDESAPLPAVPDGEDVPARLDAAADALAPFAPAIAPNLRRTAEWLRIGPNAAGVRAAVAAALSRPTGGEQA